MKAMTDSTTLMTEAEVSELLVMAVKTLQNRRFRGQGPTYVKVGRLVRYRQQDIDRFILDGLVEPKAV